jgi:ornithine cyclodeaminase/alanine dehydrogenase-like protein (mu-crystallin family)
MALLLNGDDLRPLFESTNFYPDLFQVISDSLLQQNDADPGFVSWLAFPTSHENKRINLHLSTTPVEGTSVRIFPHRVGPQARDSMFTLIFDDQDQRLLALISLDEMGPMRTAAPVAFACQYLAPPQSRVLALIGSGLQARYHLRALRHALPSLERILVYSPTSQNRQRFAAEMSVEIGIDVVAVDSSKLAVEGADVVVVTAASREPVLASEDVRPGALVTSIAAWALPRELQARARVAVPALVGPVHHPSGWDPFPFKLNGGRDPSTIAVTLVDVLHGKQEARQHKDDIILYEQVGSFAWDGAMTRWLYDWAIKHQVGTHFFISPTF